MKIKSRLTHNFIQLKVDEIETTIFKNTQEAIEIRHNLLSVIEDLCRMSGQHFYYQIEEVND